MSDRESVQQQINEEIGKNFVNDFENIDDVQSAASEIYPQMDSVKSQCKVLDQKGNLEDR